MQVSKEQIGDTQELIDVVNELDQSNLNMDNLSKNKQSEIKKLSKEAQEFYYIFEQVVKENGDDAEKAIATLATYYQSMNNVNVASTKQEASGQVSASSIGAVKNYYLSNTQVNNIIKDAGLYGGTWAVLSAIAKAFAKKPTLLTAMLVAIPVLGVAALNECNKYSKGVVITDVRIGATHSWSCAARK
ncbi:hypothetical protein P9443_01365 [Peribacillus frigoritolerans]|uniref:hypothetical protein n=1 Tax=Peribacillus frigoritolerans TaxID=450367 RepID=UPI002E231A46|nr:hypothetical protein [Peribacillus frigoritolerans]